MKYAFIMGSNAFITSHNVISYATNGESKEFVRINHTVKHKPGAVATPLDVNVDVCDARGTSVKLSDNVIATPGFHVEQTNDRVRILKSDDSLIIDIHELSDEAIAGLSHHITAELDREDYIVVIRLNGHFRVGDLHISIDNEKLFIDDNSYAESVQVEHSGGIVFTAAGLLM